jgi:hypothetical protein
LINSRHEKNLQAPHPLFVEIISIPLFSQSSVFKSSQVNEKASFLRFLTATGVRPKKNIFWKEKNRPGREKNGKDIPTE